MLKLFNLFKYMPDSPDISKSDIKKLNYELIQLLLSNKLICISHNKENNKPLINKDTSPNRSLGNITGHGSDIYDMFLPLQQLGNKIYNWKMKYKSHLHKAYLNSVNYIKEAGKHKKLHDDEIPDKIVEKKMTVKDLYNKYCDLGGYIECSYNVIDENDFHTSPYYDEDFDFFDNKINDTLYYLINGEIHKLHVPVKKLFYTKWDILHDLRYVKGMNINKVNSILSANEKPEFGKLPAISPTIKMHHVIDDSGDTHWIKKNNQWHQINTSITPLTIGKDSTQVVVSCASYHKWKILTPLKREYRQKYQIYNKLYLIDNVLVPKQVKLYKLLNNYKKKYSNDYILEKNSLDIDNDKINKVKKTIGKFKAVNNSKKYSNRQLLALINKIYNILNNPFF